MNVSRGIFGILLSGIALLACDAKQAANQGSAPMTPTRTGYANVEDGRIYFQIFGELAAGKTPLLVLHGSFMSADGMRRLVEQFASSRPVIAIDQRGHGRTGDLPKPMTYELLADDAAEVLQSLNVTRADVLGFSLGATAAILMAVRHPESVGKQIILSGAFRRDGWYPEVRKAMADSTPEDFAGSPMLADYKRLSPNPDGFPKLVRQNTVLEAMDYDQSADAVEAISGKTMIIVGDADAVDLEHAVKLFKLRGGFDSKVVTQGFMPEAPRARLAILPATSHIGLMAHAVLIRDLAVPFLDDIKPVTPPGFLPEQ